MTYSHHNVDRYDKLDDLFSNPSSAGQVWIFGTHDELEQFSPEGMAMPIKLGLAPTNDYFTGFTPWNTYKKDCEM